jgi:hypothetical protein
MLLPLHLESRFTTSYNGFRSVVLNSSVEYHNFTTMLKDAGVSFRTKITKHKKRGREFVVMLVQEI